MITRKIYLSVLSIWFALTCFIDFIAVPTIFRNVSSRVEAGDIGMILFTMINKLELGFAIFLVVLAYFFRDTIKKKVLMFTTLISLVILTVVYNVHMTPQVREQTLEMRNHDSESPQYIKAQETHEFYHSLYKKTDGVKILTLLFLIVATIKRKEEAIV